MITQYVCKLMVMTVSNTVRKQWYGEKHEMVHETNCMIQLRFLIIAEITHYVLIIIKLYNAIIQCRQGGVDNNKRQYSRTIMCYITFCTMARFLTKGSKIIKVCDTIWKSSNTLKITFFTKMKLHGGIKRSHIIRS